MGGAKPIKTDSVWCDSPAVSQGALGAFPAPDAQVDMDEGQVRHAPFGILIYRHSILQ
ncbi:hypothetical protein ACUXQ2_002719 [Cupriavidus metallidurans]